MNFFLLVGWGEVEKSARPFLFNPKKKGKNMANEMNQVDVFGLFDALYKDGHAKLSDHFIDNKSKTENVCQKK